MRLGEFLDITAATKDTIRHYEQLHLLQPKIENTRRIYSEKEVSDFAAIKEMQFYGMSLNEIQVIFDIKRNAGCGSEKLFAETIQTLKAKLLMLEEKEKTIKCKQVGLKGILRALGNVVPKDFIK